ITRNVERAVGNLDVREALLDQPRLELVEFPLRVDGLEESAAADDRRLERAVERDLLLEVVRDVAGAPAELHDVDELSGRVEQALYVADVQPLVEHMGETFAARLAGPCRHTEESVVKAGHRSPPVSFSRLPAR